jgi:hypothetical protein
MDSKTLATLAVTVLLAIVGYVVTYLNTLRLARRKDRLDRIDRQLREYYGPLYALTESADKSFTAFRLQVGRPTGPFWDASQPPNEGERAAWRLWMRHVLMPLNARIETVLVERADLLEGREMPGCLLDLLAHIAAYKAVIKAWDDGDFSHHISVIDYPEEVNRYVKREYLQLKALQQTLIGIAPTSSVVA